MRFTLLVMAASALVMAVLACVTQMGETPSAGRTSPTGGSAESRKPGTPMPGRRQTFDRKTTSELSLAERLRRNPHAALEWLLETSGPGQSSSLSADPKLLSAVTDAADRLMRMTRLQSEGDNPVALGNFVQLWAKVDLHSAYEWAHKIPTGRVRDALMVRVAFVGSQIAPAEAACLVVEEIPPGLIQEEAAVMVLHRWALQDPASAAAWVDLFPDDPFRERLLGELQGVTNYHQASMAAP